MAAGLHVRGLDRGLDVLEFLGANGPSSLHAIHHGTGLPKSSLRRLLSTLVERHFVRVGLSDGMYRTNIGTLRAVNPDLNFRVGRLVEIARPHMLNLTNFVKWPVDLHICVNDRMRIIESTHGLSPFGSAHDAGTEVELNMFVAASGLAYLAALNDAEIIAMIDLCRREALVSPERYAVKQEDLLGWLNEIRRLGYAKRRTTQLRNDKRQAIAVAVREGGRPIGALAMAWPREFMEVPEFAALHFEQLKSAAARVSDELSAASIDSGRQSSGDGAAKVADRPR
jgi:IclR family transcriptional regulator, mhp operon transcriptional activator